jgi:CrcB protein
MNDLSKVLLVGSGGFLGANVRYWLGGWMQVRLGTTFPWQTLFINVTGSLIMGLFMGLTLTENSNPNWRLFIAVGILGGYTTFSTFSYEALNLISERSYLPALGYVMGSAVLSIVGAWLGLVLSRIFAGGHV